MTVVLFIFLIFLLFPIEKTLSKLFKTQISKTHVLLILLLVTLLIVIKTNPISSFISIFMIIFSFSIFLFGILSNRRYIYTLALVSLALTPFMLIFGTDKLAEFFAQACYSLLVLGVLKDIFYEKIFK